MKCVNATLLLCYLILMGCSATAGLHMGPDVPDMHESARPAYHYMIEEDKRSCLDGGFVGQEIRDLFHTDREWGTATNSKEDGGGKRYTFIYYAADDQMYNKKWYEHWYQLYDYDLDGKIDDCKYYKVYKGRTHIPSTSFEDFVKKNDRETKDYMRRHNLKF